MRPATGAEAASSVRPPEEEDGFGEASVGYVFSDKKRSSLLTPEFISSARCACGATARSPASCLCRGLTRFWCCAAREACASCRWTRTDRWTSRCAPARRGLPVRPCIAAGLALCIPLFGLARATPLTPRAPHLQPGHPYEIILHKVRGAPGACAPPLRHLVARPAWSGIKLQHRFVRVACSAADRHARAVSWRAAAVVVAAHP